MRECRTNYRIILENNLRLQAELARYRDENGYIMERLEDAGAYAKRLEPLLEGANEKIIKLRMQLADGKYGGTGIYKH